jgi:hypothetical protein
MSWRPSVSPARGCSHDEDGVNCRALAASWWILETWIVGVCGRHAPEVPPGWAGPLTAEELAVLEVHSS